LGINIFFKGIFVNTDGEIPKVKLQISDKIQLPNYKYQNLGLSQVLVWFGI